jgi:hypothetical protein
MNNFLANLKTPLKYNSKLSIKYKSNVFFKNENLSMFGSFKTRLIKYFSCLKIKSIVIVCYPIHLECFYNIFEQLNLKVTIFTLKKPEINIKNNNNITIKYHGIFLSKLIETAKKFSKDNKLKYINLFGDSLLTNVYSNICIELTNQLDNMNLDMIVMSGCNPDMIYGISNYCSKFLKDTKIVIVGLNKKKVLDTYYYDFFPDKNYKNDNIAIYSTNEDVLTEYVINTYISESSIIELTSALSGSILDKLDIYGLNVVCIINDTCNSVEYLHELLKKYVDSKN